MKNCAQIEKCLTLYVMGELDRKTESKVEAHLQTCGFCQRREAGLRGDFNRIRKAIETDLRAPAGLMDSVEKAIRAQGAGASKPRFVVPAFAVAILAATMLLIVFMKVSRQLSTPEMLVVDSKHHSLHAGSVSVGQLAMLSHQIGFPVNPMPPQPGARLIDCWPVTNNSAKGAGLAFDYRGTRLTVYEVPMRSARLEGTVHRVMFGKDLYCLSCPGTSAVSWRCKECLFVVVARLSEMDLAKTAEPLIRAT